MTKSKDISSVVASILRDVLPLDKLIFYLKIERGVAAKDIREITGLSQDRMNRRLQRVYSRIREGLGANSSD